MGRVRRSAKSRSSGRPAAGGLERPGAGAEPGGSPAGAGPPVLRPPPGAESTRIRPGRRCCGPDGVTIGELDSSDHSRGR